MPVVDRDGAVAARVAATWAFRARAEIDAAARFERMADELREHEATAVVHQGAKAASADELRHRDLCARLAAQWGDGAALDHVPTLQRIGRSDIAPRDRLLWELVAVACVGETMNVALLTRSLEVAKDADIRSTLRTLLIDEVRHARLGWAHLAAERATGRGQFLECALPLILEASIEPGSLQRPLATGAAAARQWFDALFDYGELPMRELVEIYRDTMRVVVFPGLETFGIDTARGRAWLDESVPAP